MVDGFQISGIAELGDVCQDGKIPHEWLHMAWVHDEEIDLVSEGRGTWKEDGLEKIPRLIGRNKNEDREERDEEGRDAQGLPHISDSFVRAFSILPHRS